MTELTQEILAAVSGPLTALIVAMLYLGRKKLESVSETVEEGIEGRLDKIEAGIWSLGGRMQTVEEAVNGGAGQHFQPPTQQSWEPPSGDFNATERLRSQGQQDTERLRSQGQQDTERLRQRQRAPETYVPPGTLPESDR
jgi:hypothetical protein